MRFVLGMLALLGAHTGACAAPPIEAYGRLASIRSLSVSPDGTHVAYLSSREGAEFMEIYKLGEGVKHALRTDDVKARDTIFVSNDFVILQASETTRRAGYRGDFEFTGAFSYHLKKRKVNQLPRGFDDLYPAQSGPGRVVTLLDNGEQVLMPAYTGTSAKPPLDLLKVKLDSGYGVVANKGRYATIDWIVQSDGVVLAREDYDNDSNEYSIYSDISGGRKKIYEQVSERLPFSLAGVKPDKSALILIDERGLRNYASVYELGFDGKITGPVFSRADAEVEDVLLDINRVAIGVEYSGFLPRYEFFDPKLTKIMEALGGYFPGASVSLQSWSEDFSRLVIFVEGTGSSGVFYLFHSPQNGIQQLANVRPDIPPEEVAEVKIIDYVARDGLKIPALLTMPLNGATKNAPLIVMPHGGPEAHDRVGFDWMAQYFASRGYMVFQPNFRGSDGFGAFFRNTGRGEWGGKMQDDITDGVQALITSGRADPARICIVGGSYGGYAALAGGAYTPDLYKCVAAFAPVADLPLMLRTERRDHGSRHWVVDYWQELIGDPRAEKEKLEAISPVNSAATFKAPVLLIHGRDDTVVPLDQSRVMERALKAAGKDVEFITLKGEDHWMSSSDTRLETLKALDTFVTRHLGAN